MTHRVSACHDQLELVNNQLGLLSEPCRTVIIVSTAVGIIGNGGFQYFFEMNFDDEPPYAVFVDVFHRVGLSDIADRLAGLVAFFPFEAPHRSPQLRQQFLDAHHADFDAAVMQLEDLIFALDTEQLLERYLESTAPAA